MKPEEEIMREEIRALRENSLEALAVGRDVTGKYPSCLFFS